MIGPSSSAKAQVVALVEGVTAAGFAPFGDAERAPIRAFRSTSLSAGCFSPE
jgi:hypothetical protein